MKKNNKTLEELLAQSKTVTLSEDEKSVMRHSVLDDGTETAYATQGNIHGQARPSLFHVIFAHHMRATVIAGLVVVFLGSTAVAAEEAAPGDVLYPVKTEVNERVAGAFSFSTEAKAEHQSRLADRRAEEIVQLASENRLNAETRASIEARFEEHIENLSQQVAELESEGNVEAATAVSSSFETKMNARKAVLTDLDDRSEEVSQFSPSLDEKINTVAQKRIELETRISGEADVDVAAQNALEVARDSVEKAEEAIERAREKERVSDNALTRAETHLESVNELIVEGETDIENEEYNEAFLVLRRAQRMAREVNLVLQSRAQLNINDEGVTTLEVDEKDPSEEGNKNPSNEEDPEGQEDSSEEEGGDEEGEDGEESGEDEGNGQTGTSSEGEIDIDVDIDSNGEWNGIGPDVQGEVEAGGEVEIDSN